MRVELSPDVIRLLYFLREDAADIRAVIEELRTNPRPADAIDVSDEPGWLQKHVRIGDRGFWLMWEIKQDRSETVVRVVIIEQN
jgi:hypothetical protein